MEMGAAEYGIIAVAILFSYVILYYVIKGAIKNAIKESGLLQKSDLTTRLLSRYVQSKGIDKSDINKDLEDSFHA